MRWFHLDGITELIEKEKAVAVKVIPGNADYLKEHYPGFPVMPESLLIESMAQVAGLLIGKSTGFTKNIILAKIDKADFFAIVRPGDGLTIEAGVAEIREEGAMAECRINIGDTLIARSTLIFAFLPVEADGTGSENFVFSGEIKRLFGLMERNRRE
jgi:3-hydroxyacyl-[acyl-carrier-protein] dehydratase